MKAGSLDRVITVQRFTEQRDDLGQVTTTWATIATLRAQKIQASTTEYLKGEGFKGEAAVVFRVRWLDGLTVKDRVLSDGIAHDIKELKEIGRRKGLDIRTVASGATGPA